jgi:hypothetical protein
MPGGNGPPADVIAPPEAFVLFPMPISSAVLEAALTMPGGKGGSPPPPMRMKPPEFPVPELRLNVILKCSFEKNCLEMVT